MRIRVLACLGIVAVLGLAACGRSNPQVAAYVGDQTLTEQRVNELHGPHREGNAGGAPVTRAFVVNMAVVEMVCGQLQRRLGFNVQQPQIPAGVTELQQVGARTQACVEALPAGEPIQPTEGDLRRIFETGVANGIWSEDNYQEVRASLVDNEEVAASLGRKKAIGDAIQDADLDVTVNPRYGTVELALAQFGDGSTALGLPFGEPGPVTDGPIQNPAPTPTSQPQ